jgi:hypothetical protein
MSNKFALYPSQALPKVLDFTAAQDSTIKKAIEAALVATYPLTSPELYPEDKPPPDTRQEAKARLDASMVTTVALKSLKFVLLVDGKENWDFDQKATSDPLGCYFPKFDVNEFAKRITPSDPNSVKELNAVGEEPVVVLYPNLIADSQEKLAKRLAKDLKSSLMLTTDFVSRSVLLHELGHHVFPLKDWEKYWTSEPFKRMAEMAADWFCWRRLSSPDQQILELWNLKLDPLSDYRSYESLLPYAAEIGGRWVEAAIKTCLSGKPDVAMAAALTGRGTTDSLIKQLDMLVSAVAGREQTICGHWRDMLNALRAREAMVALVANSSQIKPLDGPTAD